MTAPEEGHREAAEPTEHGGRVGADDQQREVDVRQRAELAGDEDAGQRGQRAADRPGQRRRAVGAGAVELGERPAVDRRPHVEARRGCGRAAAAARGRPAPATTKALAWCQLIRTPRSSRRSPGKSSGGLVGLLRAPDPEPEAEHGHEQADRDDDPHGLGRVGEAAHDHALDEQPQARAPAPAGPPPARSGAGQPQPDVRAASRRTRRASRSRRGRS